MLSDDTQELLDLDVRELDLVGPADQAPTQSAAARTITTCAAC
ncbi:hypothetical protein [Amycolatopsis pigmentata]|uniref:Thiazolylpeptide-type bacteriocin n=1 Tax=Amycolatopsis pigmentata TaxID=450801 RepID=A0ABW5G0M8_9PSEU